MSDFVQFFDLSDLAEKLYELAPGQKLTITGADFLRLFGDDELAQHRLMVMAKDHLCTAEFKGSTVILQRLDEPEDII